MTIASGMYSLKEKNKEGEQTRTISIRQVTPFIVSFGGRNASMAQCLSTRRGRSREVDLECVTGCCTAIRCEWL